MSGMLTSALLRRAHNAAAQHSQAQGVLTEAFRARYGVTYSDVDADSLIDALDYGQGDSVTLAECDRIMTNRGHPPLASRAALKEASDNE